ncbi:MAG: hypothetical protein IJ088_11620 [Clostridia bacterium]|nr:hypothetical protein [Clostridia bacterium]
MTKEELIEKIRKGTDIVFRIGASGFTILDSEKNDNGKDIAEWGGNNAVIYKDAEALVNQHLINGKPLGEWTQDVVILDYTLNGEE